MDVKPRSPLPDGATTLPARYYTDPEFFARERQRFYSAMWVCVGRDEDLAAPGAFKVCEVAGESVVLVRDEAGRVNAFYNLCRHRGTRVCDTEAGQVSSLQCPYHGWTYALDGALIGAPHMDGTAGFDRTQYPLHRVASDAWDGHLFVSLAAEPGPLAAQLCALPEKFRPWRMQDLRRRWQCRYDVRANWKLIIQNYSECLHCPVIHPVLNRLSHYMSGENEPLQPTYLGGRMDLREGIETMSMDGRCRRPWLPDLPPAERRHVYYYAILPNFLLTLAPDYMMTHTLWPQAHDTTVVVCELHFQPDDPADHRDVVEFWDMTNRQDWHVSELAQLGISSRAYRPGPYSNREDLLHAFDRFIVSVHEG